ncbi:cytochrome P450 77A3-like [Vigna angularis]|uniref:cytochrome P450 77A3-like n=1 Tax=Phaseolus angularis TaxID=3914 RepID=UPI0022B50701|nr:cytochrome P450 77A3-like [Vigna angularis]
MKRVQRITFTLQVARELRKRQVELLAPLIRNRKAYVEGRFSGDEMASPVGAAYLDSLFGLEVPGRGQLGEEELVTLVSEVISAGTDTSATAVEWALFHLVVDQEIQERLYKEIVDCVGKDGVITESHVERMPYLSAVVKETFRRHPPSHFVLSHAVTEDTKLGGYTVPKNASVEFYTAWLTEDPNMWEDPNEFRPERFLSGDGVDVDVTGTKGVRMMPFGIGRRICPAWSLGMVHINLLLAKMAQAFHWSSIAPKARIISPSSSTTTRITLTHLLNRCLLSSIIKHLHTKFHLMPCHPTFHSHVITNIATLLSR